MSKECDHEMMMMNRRAFLGSSFMGIGGAALSSLLPQSASAGMTQAQAFQTIAPKAKRVICLFMSGGASHIDLFDPKPKLIEIDGKPLPASIMKGQKFAMITDDNPKAKGSPWKFAQHGQSGIPISELLPYTSQVVDDICVIRSMHSETFNHGPSISFLTTGFSEYGRPTLGAWLSYGLGSENENLPAFVVLNSGFVIQPLLDSYWSNGFLDSRHAGVVMRSQGDPVLFLGNPKGVEREQRRKQLDLLKTMNERQADNFVDPEIQNRIASYELAYRMQMGVPEIMDISREPESMHQLYGSEVGGASFANNCLLARRLVEKGVRFIQLFHMGWDQHGDLSTALPRQCKAVDQASAALIKDLKQRGLLETTLVVWGGEFGRTPIAQGAGEKYGRDHHPQGFSMWMAGAGIKPGMIYGATDEFGFYATENRMSGYDLNATILHCMGIDHTRLTYRFQGRDYRLTDVFGKAVKPILA